MPSETKRDAIARHILASIIALIGMIAVSEVDLTRTKDQLHEAQSNHARFEGTWTPYEQRLAVARRDFLALYEAEWNHARFEGAPIRPAMV